MRYQNIGKYFSKGELIPQLQMVIDNARQSHQSSKKVLDLEIDRLASELLSRIGYWVVLVPVENLEMSTRQRLKVGNVMLSVLSRSRMSKIVASVKSDLFRNPHYISNPKSIKEYVRFIRDLIEKDFLKKTCAEAVVYSRDDDAYDEAIPRIEEALAALKLFRGIKGINYDRYFGMPGSLVLPTRRDYMVFQKGSHSPGAGFNWVGAPVGAVLSASVAAFIRTEGLLYYSKILAKANRTEIEERIVTSVLWFAKATDVVLTRRREKFDIWSFVEKRKLQPKPLQAEMMNPYDRLLKLIVSLETLLIFDDNEPIQSNLAERVALLVSTKYESRKGIVKFVKRMYRYRSSVVHHGGKGIPEKDLQQMMFLTRKTIVQVMRNVRRFGFTEVQELLEWFNKKKWD